MRYAAIALCTLAFSLTPAVARVDVSIGINLGGYPTLDLIPGYPVYYAPGVDTNYFFYDGLYWVFDGERWYVSSWYNGPWTLVDPFDVPVYLLRVPVRYYRHAPRYFHGWRADAAPRWGEHWGRSWESRRQGWDQWSRGSAPAPAPLPTYQRQYSGASYPQVAAQQAAIATQSYRYQPSDPVARQHFQQLRTRAQSAPAQIAPAQAAAQPQRTQPQFQQRQQIEQQRQEATTSRQLQIEQRQQQQQQQAPRAQPQFEQRQQVEQRQRQEAPTVRQQQIEQRQQQVEQRQRQEAPRAQPQQAAQPQRQEAPRAQPQQAEQRPQPQQHEQAPQGRGEERGRGQKEEKENK